LSVELVGNSFFPSPRPPLSPMHPAELRTRSPEVRGRLVAGVFDAAIATAAVAVFVCY
jgi:hypothetical protein